MFKKAEKAYATIGDQVSYAYTLWSMAMTHKMLGKRREALRDLKRCALLFRKTRDPRGSAYAEMGVAELELIAGNIRKAVGHLARAKKLVSAFAWEKLHLHWLCGQEADYKQAGSRFQPKKLPVNWP